MTQLFSQHLFAILVWCLVSNGCHSEFSSPMRGKRPSDKTLTESEAAVEQPDVFDLKDFPSRPTREWKYVVLHHSATTRGDVAAIDAVHRQRKDAQGIPWKGIGYHFVIGNGSGMCDGEVAATFRWEEQIAGAHAGDRLFNEFGIGICLIGNFETGTPTDAQLESLSQLLQIFSREFGISDEQIVAHRDVKPTACPGKRFPIQRLKGDLQAALMRPEVAPDDAGQSIVEKSHSQKRGIDRNQSRQAGRFSAVRPESQNGVKHVAAISRSATTGSDNE